jgi:DNA-directed RNA polymerase subunit RPC12/RpoP
MNEERSHDSSGVNARPRDAAEPDPSGPDGTDDAERTGVLTLVCLKCGNEYYFTSERPQSGMTCEKCGGAVFREFFSGDGDEAREDFQETTGRDLDPDDAEGDALPGDLIDLNRGG